LSGVYWGLTALYLIGSQDSLDQDDMLEWVMSCQKECGGFGGSERNDAHILYTLSALQILAIYDRLDLIDADTIADCTHHLLIKYFHRIMSLPIALLMQM